MKNAPRLWALVTDGATVRFFRQNGRLAELPELAMAAEARPSSSAANDMETIGTARMADHASKFIETIASRLSDLQRRNAFDELAVFAPAHVLGLLRNSMPDPVRSQILLENMQLDVNAPIEQIALALKGRAPRGS